MAYRPGQVAACEWRSSMGKTGQRMTKWRWMSSTEDRFNIAPCPSDPLALTNRLVVHPNDFPPDVEFVILRDRFVMSIM